MKAFLLMISLFSLSIIAEGTSSRHDRVDITPELSRTELEEVKELFLRGELSIEDIQNPAVWEFLYGGDIIGNGGGIVESNFNFIYQNISQYIREYLVTNRKVMGMNDYVTLASIANLAKKIKTFLINLFLLKKMKLTLYLARTKSNIEPP